MRLTLLALLTAVLFPHVSQAAPQPLTFDPGHSRLVATATSVDGRLALATPVDQTPASANTTWRIRTLSLRSIGPHEVVRLSRGGDRLEVKMADGMHRVLDLTRSTFWNMPHDPAPYDHPIGENGAVPTERRPISMKAAADHLWPARADGLDPSLAEEGLRAALGTALAVKPSDVRLQLWLVEPLIDLYTPLLLLARQEPVVPTRTSVLTRTADELDQYIKDYRLSSYDVTNKEQRRLRLFQHYLTRSMSDRLNDCAIHYRVTDNDGTWLIQFWLYYPFDVGQLGGHLHDPEHFFVEVDVLGGVVYRVFGAGHGVGAGNSIYRADRTDYTRPVQLPLQILVELDKHASAPDVDRDLVFTPGADENHFGQRSKVWGLRDLVGGNDNHVLAYERTMSLSRSYDDALALKTARTLWEGAPLAAGRCVCDLVAIDDSWTARWVPADGNANLTGEAKSAIVDHTNFKNPSRIWRGAYFPHHGFRINASWGPRGALQTAGIAWFFDVDHIPVLKSKVRLPGRVALEAFAWRQKDVGTDSDPNGCVGGCVTPTSKALGASLWYEQFNANFFGFHGGLRYYHVDKSRLWLSVGPLFQFPLGGKTAVTLAPGLALHLGAPVRYELRGSVDIPALRGGAKPFGIRVQK